MRSPSSGRRPRRPSRPASRVSGVSATAHRSQIAVPPARATTFACPLPTRSPSRSAGSSNTVARSSRTSPSAGQEPAAAVLSSATDGFGHGEKRRLQQRPPIRGNARGGEEGMLRMFVGLQTWIAHRDREEGQALAEYALILALVAVVAIGALTLLGTNVASRLDQIATAIGAA